jgi:hypothetical protein
MVPAISAKVRAADALAAPVAPRERSIRFNAEMAYPGSDAPSTFGDPTSPDGPPIGLVDLVGLIDLVRLVGLVSLLIGCRTMLPGSA